MGRSFAKAGRSLRLSWRRRATTLFAKRYSAMLPNVDVRALPPLGDLTGEALGLAQERADMLRAALALELPYWPRTNLGTFDLAALRPVYGIAEVEPSTDAYVAELQTALVERPGLIANYFGKAVPADFNK